VPRERLSAFVDAVIAIVMTILVLELKKPSEVTWEALWELRSHFFAYAVSFLWLGAMWINNHSEWYNVKRVSQKTVWLTVLMLFSASFFPCFTDLEGYSGAISSRHLPLSTAGWWKLDRFAE